MGRLLRFFTPLADVEPAPIVGATAPPSVLDEADGLTEQARGLVALAADYLDQANGLYAEGVEANDHRRADLVDELHALATERIGTLGAISLNNELRDKLTS